MNDRAVLFHVEKEKKRARDRKREREMTCRHCLSFYELLLFIVFASDVEIYRLNVPQAQFNPKYSIARYRSYFCFFLLHSIELVLQCGNNNITSLPIYAPISKAYSSLTFLACAQLVFLLVLKLCRQRWRKRALIMARSNENRPSR